MQVVIFGEVKGEKMHVGPVEGNIPIPSPVRSHQPEIDNLYIKLRGMNIGDSVTFVVADIKLLKRALYGIYLMHRSGKSGRGRKFLVRTIAKGPDTITKRVWRVS